MGARLAINLALITGSFILPLWFIFLILAASLVYFPRYYEGVYISYFIDILYAFGTFYLTFAALTLLLIADYLKRNVRSDVYF